MKIFSQRIYQYINRSMSNKGVCRTVPAKPGLLIILESNRTQVSSLNL